MNVGFKLNRTISKGLADYTAKSSNTSVATATVDGTSLTIRGVADGVATITVTDALGQTASVVTTVATSMATPMEYTSIQKLDGSDTTAKFEAGASVDGGETYADTFTAGDDLTVVGTITPDATDVGKDGELYVGLKSNIEGDVNFYYLDVDGNWQVWDLTPAGLGAEEVVTPLAATHTVSFDTGPLDAGTYKVYFGYAADGEALIYTGKALKLTVE